MTPLMYGRNVWDASAYVRFLEARVHVHLGPVQEPSAFNDPVMLIVLLLLLVPGAYAGWRIYTSSWIGNPWIWSTAVVAVFMFATSGAPRPATCRAPHSRLLTGGLTAGFSCMCFSWHIVVALSGHRGSE